jgi:hypothetical protein
MKADVFYVAGFFSKRRAQRSGPRWFSSPSERVPRCALVEAHAALREALDMVFRKNEAMVGGLPGNSFVFMEFEEGGGVFEVATLALGAVGLDVAERIHGLLELAREALALDAQVGEEAMGVDDVKVDGSLLGGRISGAVEEFGFEERDAVETPGGIGELLDELGFGGSGGLVFVEETAAMGVERCLVFGGEDGGGGG